ncbi:hypothetical protein [Pseudomonas rhizophila]
MSTPEREETDRELSRCYADIDRVTAERDALQALLTAADERADAARAFVSRLIECAGGQPSIATGYLSDILDALKPAEGGGDEAGRISLSDKALSLIDEEIRIKGLPS